MCVCVCMCVSMCVHICVCMCGGENHKNCLIFMLLKLSFRV